MLLDELLLYTLGMSRARAVWERWEQEPVDMEGAPAHDLVEVDRRCGGRLPSSCRELWSLSDGTGTLDRHGLLFFQVSDFLDEKYAPKNDRGVLLLFADWQQGMGALGLQLEPDDRGVVMCGSRVEPVAPSFDRFLELYLTLPKLWPPRDVEPPLTHNI
jgi:hypothetical protein